MYAVIDIGSNSVRLMIRADGKTLYKRVETTRLGEGLALCGELSKAAIERTAQAVDAFAREGRERGAKVYAFATAAVRAAKNGWAFTERARALSGLEVDVVSGGEEAKLALLGALGGGDGGVVDIGGASTEICYRREGEICFSTSLDVGAVRLFDRCQDRREALSLEIGRALSALPEVVPAGRTYAVGGTASTLACVLCGLESYDGEKIQDLHMTLKDVSALADKLLSLSAEERLSLRGMDQKRADIIAGGALLLSEIMKKLSLKEVYASDRDNLEGYCYLRGLE